MSGPRRTPAPHLVAALYQFSPMPDARAFAARAQAVGRALGLVGSLLVAEEGINGTLAAAPTALEAFLGWLRRDPRFAGLRAKFSEATTPPFLRFKVRLKREIVSMGAPGVARPETVGAYVPPSEWNALLRSPGVVVIDVRNAYETRIGTFVGAEDPKTERFRDFPAWLDREAARLRRASSVAMFCTGGIRCEKATAYARGLGLADVRHLEGGILAYLEHANLQQARLEHANLDQAPASESLFEGQCFVFDERVSVGRGLEPGGLTLCRGCRGPVTPEERRSPRFKEGVCCPRCAGALSPAEAAGRAERQRQVALAATQGRRHLGR